MKVNGKSFYAPDQEHPWFEIDDSAPSFMVFNPVALKRVRPEVEIPHNCTLVVCHSKQYAGSTWAYFEFKNDMEGLP